ncbi:MAG: ABC transporter ATP-binding protein [Nocardioidaceae bacterium]
MLELDGVGFRYDRLGWVFRGVSFQVPPGSVTAVLGPNGRGKTTLVRCAAGLLTPQEGVVSRTDSVGFVPQAHGGAFAYSVLDMVLMGRVRQVGVFAAPSRTDQIAAFEAIERVGISDLRDRQFPMLSGGEQQLVLIARAIAAECPILALDEPSAGLDLHNQAQVLSLLRKLVADGMAVLLTTHHPDHALYLADSVVLMMARDDVRTGDPRDLLTDDTLSALYGIEVSTVCYQQGGIERHAIVTRYDGPSADQQNSMTRARPEPAEDPEALR